MRVKDLLPIGLGDYYRRLRAQLSHPGCRVRTGHIGRHVTLGRCSSVLDGAQLGNNVQIGEYSYVNYGTIISSGAIGRFTSIGPNCMIGLPEHPIDFLSTSPLTYGSNNVLGLRCCWDDYQRPPSIGNDVWVGGMCFISQGVEIGDGAVIAAGAVVTKNVSPYEIVGGVPARHIRFRFDEALVKKLLAAPWWEVPVEELEAAHGLFGSPAWRSHWSAFLQQYTQMHSRSLADQRPSDER